MESKKETHWDNVAKWYDGYLSGEDTYQEKVIAPNLLRILNIQPGEQVLDLACGQGYFTRLVAQAGGVVTGIDQSSVLIDTANTGKGDREQYVVGNAEKIQDMKLSSFDKVYCVLAFENIKDIVSVMEGVAIILKSNTSFVLVLLHPSFRIPQHSGWSYSKAEGTQSRTVSKYLSEVAIPIELNPFNKIGKKETTTTFHRSLQWYMKIFKKTGFGIVGLEEWISHKKSQPGVRQKAEDTARKEIPMFMAIELRKL
jgi:ubiquinone/menaquinone biosynthesis C-methylase UbiE